jgi:imidazolonepropionase-like amidohydrolase
MKFKICGLLCLLLIVALLFAPKREAQTSPTLLAIIHANVIDGVGNQPLRNATVLVRNGKIESIVAGSVNIPVGATVIDLKGKWLLPGFVDAHTHISDFRSARAALASGTTTARNLGIPHFVDAGMRDLNRAGHADLPEVLSAGYHVRPQLVEQFFLDFPKLHDLMVGVKGDASVRRVVRAMVERGVDVIKVNVTERAGLPDTDPRKRTFSDEEIVAIVDEARRANLFVAAHAHGDEGAAAAVKAGVRSIEHGTYLSDATLALMKEKGTYFVPTIATMDDLLHPGGDYDNALLAIRGRHMLPRLHEATEKAIKLGIRVIAGTDTGYSPNSDRRMADEAFELVARGLSPMEAINASTILVAECLGINNRVGAIKPGFEADLIAVERDPLKDITNLQDILLVVNNGKVIVNRLSW